MTTVNLAARLAGRVAVATGRAAAAELDGLFVPR